MSDDEKVNVKAEDATPSPKKTPKSGRKKKEAKRKVQTPASEASSSSKRSRKSAQSFEPVNFKEETVDKNSIEIPAGRGDKLQDISVIHTTINNMKSEDPVLRALHKFLLGGVGGCLGRGRTPNKLLKKQVLEFSGYLPEVIEGDEESEEAERIAEERMQDKTEALSLPLIKTFCDILYVNRGPENGKIASKPILIDRMLDFLAEPSEDGITVSKGKKRGPKPKDETAEDDDVEVSIDPEKAELKAVRKFFRAYLIIFNEDKRSVEHLTTLAEEKFGLDFDEDKKTELTSLLEKEIRVTEKRAKKALRMEKATKIVEARYKKAEEEENAKNKDAAADVPETVAKDVEEEAATAEAEVATAEATATTADEEMKDEVKEESAKE
ncbi:hypothetical protein CTEN210_17586 [Chaetoceros tenuissimus]|uniref:Uncharacterized protein n=1 Tax=Chaetoceros tenuissimus TaxID=426638 RepID=A0AAD3DD04_9STRA|nr:hypothetical protein CTEN210_17586 [Chaetoceros tenuissimus]